MGRCFRAAFIFAVAFVALTGQAAAGTVSEPERDGGRAVVYQAEPGEFNELSIMLQSGRFTIQDGTTGTRDTLYVTAEAPCEHDQTPQPSTGLTDAYCPAAGVTSISVDAGDGNDSVSVGGIVTTDYPSVVDAGDGADRVFAGPQDDVVHGGAGNDTLTGNGGRDQLFGDAGDDVIDAADGVPDSVSCGDGYDTVKADAVDSIAADCEHVDIAGGEPPQDPAAQQPAAFPQVQSMGLVARISCPATCRARSELLLAGARAGHRVVGSGRASLYDAGTLALQTRLRAGATRRMRLLVRPRLTLRVTVTAGDTTTTVVRRGVPLAALT